MKPIYSTDCPMQYWSEKLSEGATKIQGYGQET